MNSCEKNIVIIDGMGGSIGKTLVTRVKEEIENAYIIAAGTNLVALDKMLGAGANEGSSDKNAIINYIKGAYIVVGPMGILIPNGFSGEMSQEIVLEICKSKSLKILIPMDKCGIRIATDKMTINHYINNAILQIKDLI